MTRSGTPYQALARERGVKSMKGCVEGDLDFKNTIPGCFDTTPETWKGEGMVE